MAFFFLNKLLVLLICKSLTCLNQQNSNSNNITITIDENIELNTDMSLFRRIYRGNLKSYLDSDKINTNFRLIDCSIIKGAKGIEDLVKYNDYILGSSNDNINGWLLNKNINEQSWGSIVQIDIDTKQLREVVLEGLPFQYAFHPHGLSVYKDKLYVVNTAYKRGGQRVEVFKIIDRDGIISLRYYISFKLDDSFMGRIGDIAMFQDDKFYITTQYPTIDKDIPGRNSTEFNVDFMLNKTAEDVKDTFVYYCYIGDMYRANCEAISQTASLMLKGITFDNYSNRLYVSRFIEKYISVYEIDLTNPKNLNLIKNYRTDFAVANINYDEQRNKLFGAFVSNMGEYFNFFQAVKLSEKLPTNVKLQGGGMMIDLNNGRIDYLNNQNSLKGVNSMVVIDGNYILGSWFDNGILQCE
jgi:hypothetical protein